MPQQTTDAHSESNILTHALALLETDSNTAIDAHWHDPEWRSIWEVYAERADPQRLRDLIDRILSAPPDPTVVHLRVELMLRQRTALRLTGLNPNSSLDPGLEDWAVRQLRDASWLLLEVLEILLDWKRPWPTRLIQILVPKALLAMLHQANWTDANRDSAALQPHLNPPAWLTDPALLEALLESLKDPNSAIRRVSLSLLLYLPTAPRNTQIPTGQIPTRIESAIDTAILGACFDPIASVRQAGLECLAARPEALDQPWIRAMVFARLNDTSRPEDWVFALIEALAARTEDHGCLAVLLARAERRPSQIGRQIVQRLALDLERLGVREGLFGLLASKHIRLRRTALLGLAQSLADPEIRTAMQLAAKDSNPELRDAARDALARWSAETKPLATSVSDQAKLGSQWPQGQQGPDFPGLRTLERLPSSSGQRRTAIERLSWALRGTDFERRSALAFIERQDHDPRLGSMLREAFEALRLHTRIGREILALLSAYIPDPKVLEALCNPEVFEQYNPEIMTLIAAHIHRPMVRRQLLRSLGSKRLVLRERAATALGVLSNDPEVRAALLERLGDHAPVALAAARALSG